MGAGVGPPLCAQGLQHAAARAAAVRPVGSSKSIVARLLKRGLEDFARTDADMLFRFAWKGRDGASQQKCPMNEEPLNLAPYGLRPALFIGKDDADLRSIRASLIARWVIAHSQCAF